MKKWLIILGTLPILVILAGMFKFNILSNLEGYDVDGNKVKKELGYYEKLRQECKQKTLKNCCLASVERMEKIGARLTENNKCKEGYRRELMMCIDSFVWCEQEKNEKKQEIDTKMIVKIPTWKFDKNKDDFITTFKEYEVEKSPAVLNATFKKMFELKGGDAQKSWNGLKFDFIVLKNGLAEIKLKGNWYPVGDMSGAYFRNEIESAAFQFSTVKNIKVFINEKVFDWCIDSEAEPEEDGCDKNPKLWDTTLK